MRLHSSHGWLLIVPSWEPSLSLFNPLSGTYIQLRDNSSLDYETAAFGCPFYVKRFCLSCSPSTNPDDFQVMIVTGQNYKLALWRPGDSDWTPVDMNHLDLIPDASFTDVTYYRGEFFAITLSGLVLAVHTGAADTRRARKEKLRPGSDDGGGKDLWGEEAWAGDPVTARLIANARHLLKSTFTDAAYLVVVHDKLIIVTKRLKECYSFSKKDLSMMIEVNIANGTTTEVYDLGNTSIFLGQYNEGMSIEATSTNGCKPNCMYFANYVMESQLPSEGMSIFNLTDSIYEDHCKSKISGHTPLLWIEPCL